MSCDAFCGLDDTYMLESESLQIDVTASLVTRTQSLLLNSRPITGPNTKSWQGKVFIVVSDQTCSVVAPNADIFSHHAIHFYAWRAKSMSALEASSVMYSHEFVGGGIQMLRFRVQENIQTRHLPRQNTQSMQYCNKRPFIFCKGGGDSTSPELFNKPPSSQNSLFWQFFFKYPRPPSRLQSKGHYITLPDLATGRL